MGQLDLFAWQRPAPPAPPTCPDVCKAAATDGVVCAPEECDIALGIRPTVPAKPAAQPWPFLDPHEPGEGAWPPNRHAPAELIKPLRDYQEECRDAVHSHFETEARALVVMGTGAGKTVEFAALAADVVAAEAGRVLVLTDQFDLVDQAIEKIKDVAGLYADAEQGDRVASPKARVVVATVQSMAGRLDRYPADTFALVVCDECDRAEAPQWQAVISHFAGAKVLGVTATPNRADRKSILRTFETKVFEISALELIRRGYLVPITVRELPLKIDLSTVKVAGGDYDATELGHVVQSIFGEVLEWLKEIAPHRKTLVFCPDVASSKKFAAVASLADWTCRHIDGTSPNRRELKKGFSEWRPGADNPHHTFQVMVNPILLGRGYDEPSIDCVVNLRPTGSISLYQQIVGRGTRLWCPWGCGGPCDHPEAKQDLLVLDFLYQFKELGPVRPADLVTDSPTKRAEIQRRLAMGHQLDLATLEAEASAAMEANLVQALMDAAKKRKGAKGEYFNALEFAANLHVPELLDYAPETDAEAEPCPDRLLKKLALQGIQKESVVCVGQAQRLLQVLQARKEAGLAGMKSVFWLRKWGYPNPENISAARAKSILAKQFRSMGKI
jgi:superfamily II DNA or RNA helicase